MQHKLLVVIEDGPTADAVTTYVARACAGNVDSSLRVVLYTQLPGLPPGIEAGESAAATSERETFETKSRRDATERLVHVRQQMVANGVPTGSLTEVIADDALRPVHNILTAAREHACDTIVMGRHHKSMIREFFAGDVEEKLLRHPNGFTVWLVE